MNSRFSFHGFMFRPFAVFLLLCFLNLILSPSLCAESSQPESKLSTPQISEGSASPATAALLGVYSTTLSSSDLKKTSVIVAKALKESTPFQFLNSKEIEKRLERSSTSEAFLSQIDDAIAKAWIEYYAARFDKAFSILQNPLIRAGAFDMTPALQKKISAVYLNMANIFADPQFRSDLWAACVNAVAADPTQKPDPARFAEAVTSNVSKAKPEYQKITGSLSIETDPPGAKVLLGGQALGTTPAVFKNLPLGVHSIHIQKEGFGEVEKSVLVSLESDRNRPIPVWVDLTRKGRSNLQGMSAYLLTKKNGYEAQIQEMALLGYRTEADPVFAARVEQGMEGLEFYLIQVDVGQQKGSARAYVKAINLSDLSRQLPAAVTAMNRRNPPPTWTDLIAVGQVETDSGTTDSQTKRPFYKKWPFYVAIGVLAAGAGAGTAFMLKGGGSSNGGPVTVSSPAP